VRNLRFPMPSQLSVYEFCIGCVWLSLQLLALSSAANASELNALKLFYSPEKKVEKPNIEKQKAIRNEIVTDTIKNSKANSKQKNKVASYQYNGFITSTNGRVFIVNGERIERLAGVKILSVSESGRQIRIQLPNNRKVFLSITRSPRKR